MRSAWRCLPLFVLVFATAAWAQDRAKPRDEGKREAPPRTGHPSPEAAPQPPSSPKGDARSGAPSTATNSQRRRPRPDGRAVPRAPSEPPDAQARHPRPDPDRAYREKWYGWRQYQDERWHGPQYRYYFPYRYDGPRWRMLFRGFYLFPHARLPRPDIDDGWYYWPYQDAPERGCGWYRVPTRRWVVDDLVWGRRWHYGRWRLIYLCFD